MKQKTIDRGHYVEAPLEATARRIAAGTSLSLCVEPEGDMAFVLEDGASLELCLLMLSGAGVPVRLTVDFVGSGARADICGAYVCRDGESLPLNVNVRHRSGGCESHQLFNGIVTGSARAAFEGRIVVAPDAQGTKAFQENHNLLLGTQARAETRPQLEIYADDVECSHGATVGFLNDDELFYMRSRGIPESEARALQMISFLSPVLAHVPEGRRDDVAARIEETVRGL